MNVQLLLEDGNCVKGEGFGADAYVSGEVVFNTGMTGYVEALTDPSYRGQILVLTYPLVGNYGVPGDRDTDLGDPYESGEIQVQGLVVQNYVAAYSHHAAERSLHDWLLAAGVPGISTVDTRQLTRLLRRHGTMRGELGPALVEDGSMPVGIDMREEVFRRVSPGRPILHSGGDRVVMLIDVGAKDNIARCLLDRGASVLRVPWDAKLQDHAEECAGIVIGNGPGDPRDLMALVMQIRELLTWYRKPVFGICLGNQILGLAAGAKVEKLPYGHRGVNQPVQDLLSRRCFITSQNHGYALVDDSLPQGWSPWFTNLNDGTNEGIRSQHGPYCGVQFHPEANPGPRDTAFLFDEFLSLVGSPARR